MTLKQLTQSVDLREIVEKLKESPLSVKDVHRLSVSSRCALIKKMIEKQGVLDTKTEDATLIGLNNTFNISSNFYEWHRKKRHALVQELMRTENKPILTGFKNWTRISTNAQKWVLRKSVQLHRHVYVEGVTERFPYEHKFQNGTIKYNGRNLTTQSGGFKGNLNTGAGRITQYTQYDRLELDPLEAFNTAHHEGEHLIQHHLSVAFHRNQISPSHPLFKEAEYFCHVDKHQAYIPSGFNLAYLSQPTERLAHMEGDSISQAIKALAL